MTMTVNSWLNCRHGREPWQRCIDCEDELRAELAETRVLHRRAADALIEMASTLEAVESDLRRERLRNTESSAVIAGKDAAIKSLAEGELHWRVRADLAEAEVVRLRSVEGETASLRAEVQRLRATVAWYKDGTPMKGEAP